jgi:hypothetical protein
MSRKKIPKQTLIIVLVCLVIASLFLIGRRFQVYPPEITIEQPLPPVYVSANWYPEDCNSRVKSTIPEANYCCRRLYSSDTYCNFNDLTVNVPYSVKGKEVLKIEYIINELEGNTPNLQVAYNSYCQLAYSEPSSYGTGELRMYGCVINGLYQPLRRYQVWSGTFSRELPFSLAEQDSFKLNYAMNSPGDYMNIKSHKIVYHMKVECLYNSDCPQAAPVCFENKCVPVSATFPTTTVSSTIPSTTTTTVQNLTDIIKGKLDELRWVLIGVLGLMLIILYWVRRR